MATIWPCDQAIDCPCGDNPLGNFSSEAADPVTFFARFPVPGDPPLGAPPRWWEVPSCLAACYSSVSQADADACAERNAMMCIQPPGPPSLSDPVLFGNRATSCQSLCPEGAPFTLNIPAGTYLGRTQELADLIAESFCLADVIEFRHCDMPPTPPPESGVCPHITTQTASPINANDGDSVTMTVNYTYASAMMLMFVWFKDGVATYATANSTLTLVVVGPSDSAEYILGIYASGCFPVFSAPIDLNVMCFAETAPPAAPLFNLIDGIYDYAVKTSIGSFEVQETGNTNGVAGQNSTSLGALAAGWYDVVYQGGGTEFTDPFAIVFYNADGFGAEFEVGGVPSVVVDYPADVAIFATCNLAESNIAAPGTSLTGPFITSDSGGGLARVWGAAYATVPGWTMAKCNGKWPTLEVFNYVLDAMPLDIQISNFTDFASSLDMCLTCQDRVGVEWDGTLQLITYDPFFLTYQVPATFDSNTISLNGKRVSRSSIEITLGEDPPGTPIWKLTIKCKNIGQPDGGGTGQIIWSGIKAAGRNPVGTYVSLQEACNPGKNPECCHIEEI